MKHTLVLLLALLAFTAAGAEQPHRHRAPITVTQPGSFVQLDLPPATWAHSRQPGLADLRLLDARGDRVPFALLPAREPKAVDDERLRPATLYPLPPRRTPGAALAAPVEVLVQGEQIRVRRLGNTPPAGPDTPGWLIDLGERKRDEPAPRSLRLAWSGPASFSASFDIDTSATLREWRPAGSGQLLSLASTTVPLVQRELPLPASGERFVRLVWREPASAPRLSGAEVVALQTRAEPIDPPTRLTFAPHPEPAGPAEPPKPAWQVDLGGALPLRSFDLELPPGTRVLPVRLQGRTQADEPWQPLGATVIYRLQRDGTESRSPPLALQARVRYLRVLFDERSTAPDPALTRAVVHAALPRLVMAAQGSPPYTLLTGSADATPGALPPATLVPTLDEERPRFGRAQLGPWTEDAAAALADDNRQRQAALRPWMLWAVLLASVLGLAAMVWRLLQAR
jgi:hypothetical protein